MSHKRQRKSTDTLSLSNVPTIRGHRCKSAPKSKNALINTTLTGTISSSADVLSKKNVMSEKEIATGLDFKVGDEIALRGRIRENEGFKGEILSINSIDEGLYTLSMVMH